MQRTTSLWGMSGRSGQARADEGGEGDLEMNEVVRRARRGRSISHGSPTGRRHHRRRAPDEAGAQEVEEEPEEDGLASSQDRTRRPYHGHTPPNSPSKSPASRSRLRRPLHAAVEDGGACGNSSNVFNILESSSSGHDKEDAATQPKMDDNRGDTDADGSGSASTRAPGTMNLDANNPFPWLKKSSANGKNYNPKAPPSSPRMSKTRKVRSSLFDKFTVLSYFKVLILCIPPCYWPFSWPRLRQRKRQKRSAAVDYLDYEESTNEKRNNKTAAKKFIIDHDLQGFADMRYMPEARNGVIRLIYLITINSLGCGKRPYTRSQQDIFKISTKADWWTMLCLNLAMVFVPIFGLASLFAALTFIKSLNDDEVILLPAVLSAGFGFISGVLGVVSTGTNPHFASVAANEKQNVLAELENEYATLAIDLLEMYDSQDRATRDFARRIARGLKIGIIQELLSKHTEWGITEPLREAKRFILHKNVCFHSTVIRTYLTKDHRHQMKRRKALSKAENYFKKLNIPMPDDDCMSSEYGMMDLPSEDTATEFEDDDKINPILNATEPTDELQRRDTNHRRKESVIEVLPTGDDLV